MPAGRCHCFTPVLFGTDPNDELIDIENVFFLYFRHNNTTVAVACTMSRVDFMTLVSRCSQLYKSVRSLPPNPFHSCVSQCVSHRLIYCPALDDAGLTQAVTRR